MKRTGPRTEPWVTLQVRSEGEDFTLFYSYCLCPTLEVKIRERQSKITDTESVFEASQKDAMIVSKAALRSRRVKMEIEPESEAVRRPLKTRRIAVSVLRFGRKADWKVCQRLF